MRIKFLLCYDGNFVNGWTGTNGIFIKNLIEEAFFKVSKEKVEFFCSGRTDSGVHAINQICHTDYISEKLSMEKIKNGMNFYLPNFIKIKECSMVSCDFHARFSEQTRHYMYQIYINDFEIPFLLGRALHIKKNINLIEMQKCIDYIIGQHDISTFCPNQYTGRRIRTLDRCFISKDIMFFTEIIQFHFQAIAFAHHQIRNTVGCLLEVGKNNWNFADFVKRFQQKDRTYGATMVPSYGLYFLGSTYKNT